MPTPPPDEPEQDRSCIHPDDPVLKIMAIHLRKTAEAAARQELRELIERGKQQQGKDAPKDL